MNTAVMTQSIEMEEGSTERFSLSTFYQICVAVFCVVLVVSNIISAKLINLPLLGYDFVIPAGLITYPLTFLISDLVSEIFGPKRAKLMVYLAFAMNLLSFGIIQMALALPSISEAEQMAFKAVLGLSGIRIFSSLTAYLAGQIVDVQLYARIRKWTGEGQLWLRNNGSTCASQIVDTVLVDILFLYWGLGMSLQEVIPIMGVSYLYKAAFSIATTPFFYAAVFLTKSYWKPAVLMGKN
jgi:uncharacterized integral membrane protein (TIGR00697 family)